MRHAKVVFNGWSGAFAGAVGLPLLTILIAQAFLAFSAWQGVPWDYLLLRFGTVSEFHSSILLFQVPAGILLGASTGIMHTFLRKQQIPKAKITGWIGSLIVAAPLLWFSSMALKNASEDWNTSYDAWLMLLFWFGLPLLWSILLLWRGLSLKRDLTAG